MTPAITDYWKWTGLSVMYLNETSSNVYRERTTVRALVFGMHQFFGTSEHYGKAHGSLLSG